MQKYGWEANLAVTKSFQCIICKTLNPNWEWSDYHGEGMCGTCGTPYQLLQYDKDNKRIEASPKINVKKDWIPLLKQYWEETQAFMGLGSIMLFRDYPECEEGQKKFYAWLDNHKELIPPKKNSEK